MGGDALVHGGGHARAEGAPPVRNLLETGTMAGHISTAFSQGLRKDWSAPPRANPDAPTPTPTSTLSPTPAPTPTHNPALAPTPTIRHTPRLTASPTLTPTPTPTPILTPTPTPTPSPSPSPTPTSQEPSHDTQPGMPNGKPSSSPEAPSSSFTNGMSHAVWNTTTGSVKDTAARHLKALPGLSRLHELIPSAAERAKRGKQAGAKAGSHQQGQGKGTNTPIGPSQQRAQAPKAPSPLGMRVSPCPSVVLPRYAGAPGRASGVPAWAVEEGHREVDIALSRNLSPKVTLVTEARASRLALGDCRVRVQRIGSLPWRRSVTVPGKCHGGVTVSGDLHGSVTDSQKPDSTVTDLAARVRAERSVVVSGPTVTNSTARSSSGAEVVRGTGGDSLEGAAQAVTTSSCPSSFPLHSSPPYSPSTTFLPEVPLSLSAALLTDFQHRASLSLLACVGRVEADSLSLLLSSAGSGPLPGWRTRDAQGHTAGTTDRVAQTRGGPSLTPPDEPQGNLEAGRGGFVRTTAAIASSHVVSHRTRLCTRLTVDFGAPGAPQGWHTQGGTGTSAAMRLVPAKAAGVSKVYLQAVHRVTPQTAVSAALSYKLGGPADLGLILSKDTGTAVGPAAWAGTGAGEGAGQTESVGGTRNLWEALGFGAKAFVNTKGMFSVFLKVSGGDCAAIGTGHEEQKLVQ